MKTKKLFLAVLIVLLTGGIIFAAGGGQQTRPADGHVQISATYAMGAYDADPATMVTFDRMAQETGVRVNWILVPEVNWNERKNIMVNSGDVPDVFYRGGFSAVEIDRWGRQGVFLDLTNEIPRYMPNLSRIYQTDPTLRALSINYEDNKIYAIRGHINRFTNNLVGVKYIYKPWLDKLGIPFPKTFLEFENMLRRFKNEDPNGNGIADEFPFVFANGWSDNSSIQQFFAMFGYGYNGIRPNGGLFIENFERNGGRRAVFVPGTPNFRDAIIWLHRLFSEGLLAEEDYTGDRALFSAKMYAEPVRAGSFSAWYKDASYTTADRYDDYIEIVPPLIGPNGHQIHLTGSRHLGTQGTILVTMRGRNRLPDILRWVDNHFDRVRSFELFYGAVGVGLQQGADGMFRYIPPPAGTTPNQWIYGNSPHTGVIYIPRDAWGRDIEVFQQDVFRYGWWDKITPFLTQAQGFQMFPIAEETAFIQAEGLEINTFVKTTQARWLMQGGIQQEWDSFQSRLRTMGVERYTRIMQNQLDRFDSLIR